MDSRIKDLGKDQRIALARIVYDLIMADKIIDDEEITKFADLFGEENNRNLFRQAQEHMKIAKVKPSGNYMRNNGVNKQKKLLAF